MTITEMTPGMGVVHERATAKVGPATKRIPKAGEFWAHRNDDGRDETAEVLAVVNGDVARVARWTGTHGKPVEHLGIVSLSTFLENWVPPRPPHAPVHPVVWANVYSNTVSSTGDAEPYVAHASKRQAVDAARKMATRVAVAEYELVKVHYDLEDEA